MNGLHLHADQQGSALVIVLLALLLLTTLGLGLALVTENEMLMGGAERVMNQTFYAADSGIQVGLGKLLTTQDWSGAEFAIVEDDLGSDSKIGERVKANRIHAVGAPRPAPMTIANEGQDDYKTYFVVAISSAQRVSWPATDPVPSFNLADPNVPIQAQSTVTSRFMVSPLRQAATAEEPFSDQEALIER